MQVITHPANTFCQHTTAIHPIKQPTNIPFEYTLLTHSINTPRQRSYNAINTPRQQHSCDVQGEEAVATATSEEEGEAR